MSDAQTMTPEELEAYLQSQGYGQMLDSMPSTMDSITPLSPEAQQAAADGNYVGQKDGHMQLGVINEIPQVDVPELNAPARKPTWEQNTPEPSAQAPVDTSNMVADAGQGDQALAGTSIDPELQKLNDEYEKARQSKPSPDSPNTPSTNIQGPDTPITASAPASPGDNLQSAEAALRAKYEKDGLNDEDMKAALNAKRNKTLAAGIMQGVATIGSAVGGQGGKIDTNYYDMLRNQAGADVEAIQVRRKAALEQIGMDKGLAEFASLKIKNASDAERLDPQSNTSKAVRAAFMKWNPELIGGIEGYNNFSADAIDKYVAKLAELDEKLKNTKAIADAKIAAGKDEKAKKEEDAKGKWIQQVVPRIVGSQNKQYQNYEQLNLQRAQIEAAIKNPSGFKDIASIFGFMKSIDPSSVVRESEYQLGANAGGVVSRGFNLIDRITSGENLQPEQRKELLNFVNIVGNAQRKAYVRSVAPYITEARNKGIELDRIGLFDPAIANDFDEQVAAAQKRAQGSNKIPAQKNMQAPSVTPQTQAGNQQFPDAHPVSAQRKEMLAKDMASNPEAAAALKQPGKSIVKKQYSPSRNKTKIVYSDGTEEIQDGKI